MGCTSPCGDGRGRTLVIGRGDGTPIFPSRGWAPCYRDGGVRPPLQGRRGLDPRYRDGDGMLRGWMRLCRFPGLPLRSGAGYLERREAFLHPRLVMEVFQATRIWVGFRRWLFIALRKVVCISKGCCCLCSSAASQESFPPFKTVVELLCLFAFLPEL